VDDRLDPVDVALVDAGQITADGTLAPPEGGGPALTYNPAVAPAGARLAVSRRCTWFATTAIVTATFEVQMARVVREVFALTPDELP
jgi:hypothetical protein